MMKIGVILILTIVVSLQAAPLDKIKLRFKLSARGLPDKDKLGTIDPYVQAFYTEFGSDKEIEFGRSDTISDNQNPDWGTIFEFNFDRSKSQKWHFKVYDHDNAREDDGGGRVWVDVTDFVDRGQFVNAKLHKSGYLTIKSLDTPQVKDANTPIGQLPVAPGSPDTAILKFKLSASNIPDKDDLGKTDPYVELYYTDGLTGRKNKFGRSATLSNTKNPSWGETFDFNFNRKKDQQWFFKIYDHDSLREDDGAGKVWVSVNDYVAKGQVMTVHLSKRGTLTITRADGQPAGIQYNPNANVPSQVPAYPPPGGVQYNPNFPNTPQAPPAGVQQYNPNAPQQFPPYPPPGFKQPGAPVPQPPNQYYTPPPVHVPGPTPSKPVLVTQPSTFTLKFKLSAGRLEDRDLIGTSDPYVKVFATQDGSATETQVGKSTTLNDNENPEWPTIFEFNYDQSRKPKLRFLVLDEDDNRRDDELGDVTIDANDIIRSPGPLTLSLKKGSLTITKV